MAPQSLGEFIQGLPGVQGLSERSLLLLALYHSRQGGKTELAAPEIDASFSEAGLPPIPSSLSQLKKLTKGANAPVLKHASDQFALSLFGEREVKDYLRQVLPATGDIEKLVGYLAGDADRRFLADALACLRVRANRAAVVMIWLLTVDHLQRFVLKHALADFNKALSHRPEWKGLVIAVQDDFLSMRDESAFIETLKSANVVTKDVRKILDESLGFRNTCAHPNDIKIPDSKTAATIEDLVENVILKYPL